MTLRTNTQKIILFLDRNDIEKFQKVVLLRITIDNKLTFKTYIEEFKKRLRHTNPSRVHL